MTPLSPDCLAAYYRSVITAVIGSAQDGSLSHKVIVGRPEPFYFGPWKPDTASCNPHPLPTNGAWSLFLSGWVGEGGVPAMLLASGQVEWAALEQG